MRYRDVLPHEYAAALMAYDLPAEHTGLIADSDAGAQRGALFGDGRTLSTLIGRATTPVTTTIALALDAAKAAAVRA